jgi:hypothetical protein
MALLFFSVLKQVVADLVTSGIAVRARQGEQRWPLIRLVKNHDQKLMVVGNRDLP